MNIFPVFHMRKRELSCPASGTDKTSSFCAFHSTEHSDLAVGIGHRYIAHLSPMVEEIPSICVEVHTT